MRILKKGEGVYFSPFWFYLCILRNFPDSTPNEATVRLDGIWWLDRRISCRQISWWDLFWSKTIRGHSLRSWSGDRNWIFHVMTYFLKLLAYTLLSILNSLIHHYGTFHYYHTFLQNNNNKSQQLKSFHFHLSDTRELHKP